MLKLLFALGLLFGPLYRLLSGSERQPSRGSSPAPSAFLHFAPRFTIISRVSVPVNSNNVGSKEGAEPLERAITQKALNAKNGHDSLSRVSGGTTDNTNAAKLKAVKKAFLNSLG